MPGTENARSLKKHSPGENQIFLGDTQGSTFHLGHRPVLDGVRGVSILLVFAHHLYFPIARGGFVGVDIFFVLSGFLITSLLLEEWQQQGSIKLGSFYVRRVLRLMPAVLTLCLIAGIFALLFLSEGPAWSVFEGIGLTLSYVSNWIFAFGWKSANNPLGITWSLAIEEQFYLAWPPALYLALKSGLGRRAIAVILAVLIVVVAVNRAILWEQSATIQRLYYASDTRADALLVGCLLAILISQKWAGYRTFKTAARILAVVGLIWIGCLVMFSGWDSPFWFQSAGFTFLALAVAVNLLVLLLWPLGFYATVLTFPPLTWLGRVSYGLYLWHWPVRKLIYQDQALPSSLMKLFAAVFLSVALTAASYYFVERPFLRLKKRFSRNHSAGNEVEAVAT